MKDTLSLLEFEELQCNHSWSCKDQSIPCSKIVRLGLFTSHVDNLYYRRCTRYKNPCETQWWESAASSTSMVWLFTGCTAADVDIWRSCRGCEEYQEVQNCTSSQHNTGLQVSRKGFACCKVHLQSSFVIPAKVVRAKRARLTNQDECHIANEIMLVAKTLIEVLSHSDWRCARPKACQLIHICTSNLSVMPDRNTWGMILGNLISVNTAPDIWDAWSWKQNRNIDSSTLLPHWGSG